MEQTKNLVETITKGIQEKKGSNINIIDLSGIEGTICHYFIICQGNSPSQVEAITDSVEEFARVCLTLKKAGSRCRTQQCPVGGNGLYRRNGSYFPARSARILQSGKSLGRRKTDPDT